MLLPLGVKKGAAPGTALLDPEAIDRANRLLRGNHTARRSLYRLSERYLYNLARIYGLSGAASWLPPIGVPNPDFGIDTALPMLPDPWTSDVAGFFFVAPGGTNPNNGNRSSPRGTIPTTLAASDVVVLADGSYSIADGVTWTGGGTTDGTSSWIMADNPLLAIITAPANDFTMTLSGSFLYLNGLRIQNRQITVSGDHLVVRNGRVHGYVDSGHNTAIFSGTGDFFILYNSELDTNGDSENATERDIHGLKPDSGSADWWVVDNHIHHNGGDGIQVGDTTSTAPLGQRIYIGRNHFHRDRENAVDIKRAQDIIISENEIHDYIARDSSSGEGITVHGNGGVLASRVWVLANLIYDVVFGVAYTSGGQEDGYVIGNVIRDAVTTDAGTFFGPMAVFMQSTATTAAADAFDAVSGAYFNTIDGCWKGISYPGAAGTKMYAIGNIITNMLNTDANTFQVGLQHSTMGDVCKIQYNMLDDTNQAGGKINDAGTIRTLAGHEAAHSAVALNNINADPTFVHEVGNNLKLVSGSRGVNEGPETFGGPFDYFEDLYGINIRFDLDRIARAQGAAWDIGAFELLVGGTQPIYGFRVPVR